MIIISSRKKLISLLVNSDKNIYNVICITESNVDLPEVVKEHSKDYLHLQFDDIYCEMNGLVPPGKEHVEQALEWVKGKEDCVVACYAGISRSSALAYLIECARCLHPKMALSVLNPLVHHPNRRIVQLGAEILGNQDIFKYYHEWMNEHLGE